jgi:hypothetical protein
METAVERRRSRKIPNRRITERDKTDVDDIALFHPWFLPPKITYAIRRLLPPEHKLKMHDYFAAHGCLRCDEKEGHCALGMCEKCYTKLHSRLRACVRKRASLVPANQPGSKYLEDARNARRLLKGFPAKMYVDAVSRRGGGYTINNPARAAFIILNNCMPQK